MKKLKLQWKGIYALLLMLWSVPLPAQFPLVEQISSNFITSFAEDPKGYIWIGTNHGLNRFSGSNYTFSIIAVCVWLRLGICRLDKPFSVH